MVKLLPRVNLKELRAECSRIEACRGRGTLGDEKKIAMAVIEDTPNVLGASFVVGQLGVNQPPPFDLSLVPEVQQWMNTLNIVQEGEEDSYTALLRSMTQAFTSSEYIQAIESTENHSKDMIKDDNFAFLSEYMGPQKHKITMKTNHWNPKRAQESSPKESTCRFCGKMVHCQVNLANAGNLTVFGSGKVPTKGFVTLPGYLGRQSYRRLKFIVTDADVSSSTNADVQTLLDEFSNLFEDVPGQTVSHTKAIVHIKEDARPRIIRSRPVPLALLLVRVFNITCSI
ncbi:unnamed protein product [Lepeophtheirus salmonis]|uniref:(salmon louse) hypothetical protein n=1 Tax=Lepeophtheirus salmonis TaxID=72036 RepID=A0A7R8CT92_LEPSM|nr:unnamed protein product [Lepeophtheirus salmonis]CAF2924329.1 unnamed protein product [Lepeophtheirus salmonis]